MTLLEYEKITPKTALLVNNLTYLWTERSWQKDVAQFTLARYVDSYEEPVPPEPQNPYITEGLIFWLDGINKGNVHGKWTDLIGGIEFTPDDESVIFNDNNVYCPVTKGLFYNGQIEAPLSSYTIEVAVWGILGGTSYFTTGYGNNSQMMGVGSYGAVAVMSAGGINNGMRGATGILYNTYAYRLMSGNLLGHVSNFVVNTPFNNGDSIWAQVPGIATVGRGLCYGNHETEKRIYSIRIYNRQLSTSEMIHNQQIDNERFGFGIE